MLRDLCEVIVLALAGSALVAGIMELINVGIRWLRRRR